MLQPFEARKTAEELGIDTTRKFVVVEPRGADKELGFDEGTIVKFAEHHYSYYSYGCVFINKQGRYRYFLWHQLAYAPQSDVPPEKHALREEDTELLGYDIQGEGTTQIWGINKNGNIQVEKVIHGVPYPTPKPYVPQIGDVVSVQAVVTYASEQGRLVLAFAGTQKNAGWKVSFEKEESPALNLTLISRKAKRTTVTRRKQTKWSDC